MVPDRQKVWTDGRNQNYIPPTSWGDNKGPHRLCGCAGWSTLCYLQATKSGFSYDKGHTRMTLFRTRPQYILIGSFSCCRS